MQRSISPTTNVNTPEILTSEGTVLTENQDRRSWHIQNLGTNPLYVRLGGTASSTVFHVVLKGGTTNDDGEGGTFSESSGLVYGGLISVAGTSPRYVARES
jgi:hypothetical protein